MNISEIADELCDDEWTITDEGMHGMFHSNQRDYIERTRELKGHHPVYEQRKRNKKKIKKMLGNKCSHCGLDDLDLLDVHHVEFDGKQERENHNSITYWRHVRREIEKGSTRYQLLCKNCHYKLHLQANRG